jgi:hypothetical protein
MKSWKANEYATAKLLGGKRRRQRLYKKQGADVNLDVADIEVKTRKVLPKWLVAALSKISSPVKLSLIFWIKDGEPIDQGLAVMSVHQARMLLDLYRSSLTSEKSASTQTVKQQLPLSHSLVWMK